MDPKFADRMTDLGAINDDILQQRWDTLTGVAAETGQHEQARLVLVACGARLDREADAWFWEPFREKEMTIPVDDGAELFTRFAECASRYLITEKRWLLPAMFVRLAQEAGFVPSHQDLVDTAVWLLLDEPSGPPEFIAPTGVWAAASTKAIEADPTNPNIIGQQLAAMAVATQKAIAGLSRQVGALTTWGTEAEKRFDHEQRLVHWLLNGVRGDGEAWSGLDPAVVAVDAAVELADLVIQAPQTRHEATLAQVLEVAEKTGGTVEGPVTGTRSEFVAPEDDALRALVPITVALAAGDPLPKISPGELAVRVLWETTTIRLWDQ
jgi:hypothetical protein